MSFCEQNRTTSIVSHIETIRQILVIKVFNCFLRDDVPFSRNVFFDGSFFSASRSWFPIVDAEPLLFGQAIGYLGVNAVFLSSLLARNPGGQCPSLGSGGCAVSR